MVAPGTPGWLRTRNDRDALRLFLEHGALTRSRLSALSGLSKPTAGHVLARLGAAGVIAATGTASGARGPSATTYAVRADSATGVAITVHGDGVAAVVVDPTDADHPTVALSAASLAARGRARSPVADVRAAVAAACRAADVAASTACATVIGVQPGADEAAGSPWRVRQQTGGTPADARAHIERATGMAVLIEDGAHLAARAERAATDTAELPDFVYLWLGHGVGMAIDIGGSVHAGASHRAGDIAHLEVPRSAARRDPLAADVADLLDGDAIVRLLGGAPGQRLAEVLPRLSGDARALRELARRVGVLTAMVLPVLDPAAIILGGPTGSAGGARLARLVQPYGARRRHPRTVADAARARPQIDVRVSAAGPTPVLRGARALLVARLRERLDAIVAGRGAQWPSTQKITTR